MLDANTDLNALATVVTCEGYGFLSPVGPLSPTGKAPLSSDVECDQCRHRQGQ
jgi:hypothetical protein